MKITLSDYQNEIIKEAKKLKHCILKLSTGSGKTFISLASKEGKALCIVKNKEDKKQWEKSINAIEVEDVDLITMHELKSFKHTIKYDTLIIDEVQSFVNGNARRRLLSKLFSKYNFNMILLLSDTPLKKSEKDFYILLKSINYKCRLTLDYKLTKNFDVAFMKYEYKFNFFKQKWDWGYYNFNNEYSDIFNKSINVISYVSNKFTSHKKKIKLIKPKMELYKKVLMTNVMPDYYNTLTPGVKANVLRQLSNSTFKYDDDLNKIIDDDYLLKINEIKKLLEKHERAIVVVNYKNEKDLIFNNFVATENPEEFRANDNIKVLIRQIQRSTSIDVEYINCIIFFSINYSSEDFMQMHGRITRYNSKFEDLYYYYLIFTNTIESDIYDIVEKRKTKNDLLKSINAINC